MGIKKCFLEDKHEEIGKNIEKCFACNKKIGKSFKEKLREKVASIPIETKQTFLDLLHDGKTIGEAKKIVGIKDLMVAGEIIMQNMGEINYLKTVAK